MCRRKEQTKMTNSKLIKSPEEAIETIKANMPTSGYQMLREALDMAIEALKRECWIPVKERLPDKEGKTYLVTYQTPSGRYHVKEAYCEYVGETPRMAYWTKRINGEVIAWMPLPEPYRQEDAVDGRTDQPV